MSKTQHLISMPLSAQRLGISERIHQKLEAEDKDFPQPTKFRGRNFFVAEEIDAYKARALARLGKILGRKGREHPLEVFVEE